MPQAESDESSSVSAMAVADALLALATRTDVTAVAVVPGQALQGVHHAIVERQGQSPMLREIPAALADAAVARLSLLSHMDLATGREQVGRVTTKVGETTAELVLVVSMRPQGLSAELRRVVSRSTSDSGLNRIFSLAKKRLGAYRVVGELGRGAMGVVYRGEHELLQKPVAIKILHQEFSGNVEQVTRFAHEARAASRIHSPRIVNVLDFGHTDDGHAYLVMEFVEWPTLLTVLEKGPLPPNRALTIGREIALALDTVHEHGVVHRDLKPGNVFIGPKDQVKVGDFGASKLMDTGTGPRDTSSGMFCGTPLYMSPEHAMGQSTDGRTDVYAVGCIMFEMLTGHTPYEGCTPLDVLVQQATTPTPELTTPGGQLPESLVHAIQRALAKNLDERYQRASELVRDLDRSALALERKGWRSWLG